MKLILYYIRPMLRLLRHWHYLRHGLWLRVMMYELTRLMRERRKETIYVCLRMSAAKKELTV